MGFLFGKGTYLRDPWNVLDFIIVLFSSLSLFNAATISISSIRSIRVLRPLRTITSIRGLRKLVLVFFKTVPPLSKALLLLLFFFLIFALIGVQIFKGKLKNKCYHTPSGMFVNSEQTVRKEINNNNNNNNNTSPFPLPHLRSLPLPFF